jgi:hypothetical protein
MLWVERFIWYFYAGLLFAEMTRMGKGTLGAYIFTLLSWPIAVPICCAIWHKQNGGKKNAGQ